MTASLVQLLEHFSRDIRKYLTNTRYKSNYWQTNDRTKAFAEYLPVYLLVYENISPKSMFLVHLQIYYYKKSSKDYIKTYSKVLKFQLYGYSDT